MKTSEVFWMVFLQGLYEPFGMSALSRTNKLPIYGLTKKLKSEDDKRNSYVIARGNPNYAVLQDYTLRGHPVYLHIRG